MNFLLTIAERNFLSFALVISALSSIGSASVLTIYYQDVIYNVLSKRKNKKRRWWALMGVPTIIGIIFLSLIIFYLVKGLILLNT